MNGDGDVLEFSGERYITSARAAKLFGYTKDYVGQLARGGKIRARLVGRSWYVSEDSTRAHKLETHYVLTKPKKSPHEEESVVGEKSIKHVDISVPRSFENSITPPSQVHTGGHAHASRELARADFRYEGGQALTLDGAYVPPLIKKTSAGDLSQSTAKKEVGVSGENITIRRTPSHASEDAFPVHLRMAREQRIASQEPRVAVKGAPVLVRGAVGAGVDGVAVRGRRKWGQSPFPIMGTVPIIREKAENEDNNDNGDCPHFQGKGGKWGLSPLLSPKRIPVLVGLGGMGILVLLQLI